MTYNLSWTENITTSYEIVSGINDMSSGLLMPIFMLALSIIMLIYMTPLYGFKKSFTTTTLAIAFIGSLLWLIDLIAIKILIVPFILSLAGVLILIFGKED